MSEKKYVLVDDSVEGVGGTALTLSGIIEPYQNDIIQIATRDLSLTHLAEHKDKIWIFGNLHALMTETFYTLSEVLRTVRFFKIDFDYGYCRYRGRIPHEVLGSERCNCSTSPHGHVYREIYKLIKSKSLQNFYMSQEQLDFHVADLGLNRQKCSVLSSCFTEDFFLLINKIKSLQNNGRYAIIDGQGGWHTQAKGIPESIQYATDKKLKYDLLKTNSHKELMEQLCLYQGLIFLPIIHDTCPRITIEAKLLGLNLIINEKCQHQTEDWWQLDASGMEDYLRGRPKFLWDKINELSYCNSC